MSKKDYVWCSDLHFTHRLSSYLPITNLNKDQWNSQNYVKMSMGEALSC